MPGMRTSSTTQAGGGGGLRFRYSAAEANVSGRVAGGPEHHRQRVADGFVVVDDGDTGGGGTGHRCLGKVNVNMAPPCGPGAWPMRPPCISTIDRQIDSPRPRPPRLVVKNGENRRSATSGGMPCPRSLIVTRAAPSGSTDVAIASVRSAGRDVAHRVDRILHQIEQDLFDQHAVGLDRRKVVGQREVDLDVGALEVLPGPGERLAHHRVDVARRRTRACAGA